MQRWRERWHDESVPGNLPDTRGGLGDVVIIVGVLTVCAVFGLLFWLAVEVPLVGSVALVLWIASIVVTVVRRGGGLLRRLRSRKA
jgi:hypothetical protein